MYENSRSRVCDGFNLSEEFRVKVGVQQGHAHSPFYSWYLQFSHKCFVKHFLWKTYMPKTWTSSLNCWSNCKRTCFFLKSGMEGEGLEVDMGRTKILKKCRPGHDVLQVRQSPCASHSCRHKLHLLCGCFSWVHQRCSCTPDYLNPDPSYARWSGKVARHTSTQMACPCRTQWWMAGESPDTQFRSRL